MRQFLFTILLFCSFELSYSQENSTVLYSESYRPQYHFSPTTGWVSDPSGFIYHKGKYQMYWWGKVTSTDLVHYRQESKNVMTGEPAKTAYFTGSVVIDKNNTAGFGKDAQVAVYTMFNEDTKSQSQGISYSLDGGITFQYYKGNPVLDIGSTEFRDPTVFWHENTKRWIMVVALALEKKIKFYSSLDLKTWTWMSDFGPAGAQEKSWECPDLFQIPIVGNPARTKWVMVVSIDWAREQYFIGDFDGTTFTIDADQPKTPRFVDHGMDYYASRTFRDYGGNLKATSSMGWVATWDYAQHVPSKYGKGFWSIPRELQLKELPEGLSLIQKPLKNLETLRGKMVTANFEVAKGTRWLQQFTPKQNVYEMEVSFSSRSDNEIGFNLLVGQGRKLVIKYNVQNEMLTIDRTNCTDAPIEKFSRITCGKIRSINGEVKLHLYVDKSSVEIFGNGGETVFTLQTFPSEDQTGIEVFASKVGSRIKFKAWELKSIWK